MLQRPGSSWGFGALLKDTSVVVLKEDTPPTNNPCRTRDSNPQPLDYESDSLGHDFPQKEGLGGLDYNTVLWIPIKWFIEVVIQISPNNIFDNASSVNILQCSRTSVACLEEADNGALLQSCLSVQCAQMLRTLHRLGMKPFFHSVWNMKHLLQICWWFTTKCW